MPACSLSGTRSSMLLYIHGFNSSSRSGKALELGRLAGPAWVWERSYVCPDLPHRPAAAIALLEELIARSNQSGQADRQLARRVLRDLAGGKARPQGGSGQPLRSAAISKLAGTLVGQTQKNWHSGEEYHIQRRACRGIECVTPWPPISRPERYSVARRNRRHACSTTGRPSQYYAGRSAGGAGGRRPRLHPLHRVRPGHPGFLTYNCDAASTGLRVAIHVRSLRRRRRYQGRAASWPTTTARCRSNPSTASAAS
jgi:hypothetical protein